MVLKKGQEDLMDNNIDFYCFCFDTLDQGDYSHAKARHGSHIFDNMNFDIANAKKLSKFARFVKETGKFHDENGRELDVSRKRVLARCIIPEMNTLFGALEDAGAEMVVSREETRAVMDWASYISPTFRDACATNLGEFLANFDEYKENFGRVFFKTKKKNFSCEVLAVSKFFPEFLQVSSDEDLSSNKNKESSLAEFFSEPMYMVITSTSKDHPDFRFGMLPKSTEVIVQPFLEIVKDDEFKHVPVEYRSFVVDGKFVSSRSWIEDRPVPQGVLDYVQGLIDGFADKSRTFVADVLEFVDKDGKRKFDLCELNPLSCSGYEKGSTIFVTEGEFEGKYYPGLSQSEKEM